MPAYIPGALQPKPPLCFTQNLQSKSSNLHPYTRISNSSTTAKRRGQQTLSKPPYNNANIVKLINILQHLQHPLMSSNILKHSSSACIGDYE
ncbi:hypothetical protein KC19_VG288100 [Ceratodon purpureus]|uniref:Uncharacterized protein n=1 Tax=Ceratodon purpureus TaxID=3225 RepID=A0A8T0HVN5_CERPU|nr:hypothetical protein KC19_VG288100 [Ceratodon purpureus]